MRVREKVETLRDFGIDKVVCLQFNSALRNLNASEFVHRILIKGLATRFLIVGDDFRFGCDRSGDFNMLRSSGDLYDFEVQDTETLEVNGERISSTLVRTILCQSDFIGAEALLGRPFTIRGCVVYGQQLGKELGFPTANVQLNRYSAPISGVFAVLVRVGDKLYKAAANVGVRPTVGDLVKPILEVHILDFDKDIYGERIEVEFKHKIRDEKKFTSLDNLVENIQNDINKIRAWFHQANNN
jgi:riboflavin kinase/FMN adenylyltransferase